MECNALIKRKESELHALTASTYTLQRPSRIVDPTAFVSHTGPGGYNETTAVPVNGPTSSASAVPIPAERPANDDVPKSEYSESEML